MTKAERLQELKEEEHLQKQFHKVLNIHFNAGWREFVKDIQGRIDVSNVRTFKILSKLKGNEFVSDLRELMKMMKRKSAYLSFTKEAKGVLMKDNRVSNIPELWVYRASSPNYSDYQVFIQVNENRYVTFTA